MAIDVEELYSKQISRLDNADQLRLLVLLAEGLQSGAGSQPKSLHSLLELEGMGAEIWQDGDKQPMSADQYINELRNEWGHRA